MFSKVCKLQLYCVIDYLGGIENYTIAIAMLALIIPNISTQNKIRI